MRTVRYLMSGKAHLPYLVVGLRAIRKHFDDRIEVYAYPQSYEIAKRITEDVRLGDIHCVRWSPTFTGRNSQFLNKIKVMQTDNDGPTVYLDADTMVSGPLDLLFELADDCGFVATQFNDWKSNSGMPRKRISRLVGREPINQKSVETLMSEPFPSVNGGVFAADPDSPVLMTWYKWSMAVRDIFIPDETVLHTLIAEYHEEREIAVMEGGSFNCSPKFQPSYLADDAVVVWHFHGDCNVRPNKSPKGVSLWWPEFQFCWIEDIGNISKWLSLCENKHLDRRRRLPTECCGWCGQEVQINGHSEKCPEYKAPKGELRL